MRVAIPHRVGTEGANNNQLWLTLAEWHRVVLDGVPDDTEAGLADVSIAGRLSDLKPDGLLHLHTMSRVGRSPQLPYETYVDEAGRGWVVRQVDRDQAESRVLASALYRLWGVASPEARLIRLGRDGQDDEQIGDEAAVGGRDRVGSTGAATAARRFSSVGGRTRGGPDARQRAHGCPQSPQRQWALAGRPHTGFAPPPRGYSRPTPRPTLETPPPTGWPSTRI